MFRKPVGQEEDGVALDFPRQVADDDSKAVEWESRTDPSSTSTWIYPCNYPVRKYQFDITRAALASNTLVCLPTGLGKTFIAAVVMYNFYRWFPMAKIVFMAPTRPLVAQQIDACYDIVGIPPDQTVELTGRSKPDARRVSWKSHRVFFLTPQVMENDIARKTCPVEEVVCVVLDEAHRASGKYAYTGLVTQLMVATNGAARVLALSATPGNNLNAVSDVIKNINIHRLEFRDETDPDVVPYIHKRTVHSEVIKLDDTILSTRDLALKLLAPRLHRLCDHGAFYTRSPANLSKMQLMSARDAWRERWSRAAAASHNAWGGERFQVEGDYASAMTLAHGVDLLMSHGLIPFEKYLCTLQREAGEQRSRSKTDLVSSSDFHRVATRVAELVAAGGSHPKAQRCVQILEEHFVKDAAQMSRAIVFVEYRDAVAELESLLKRKEPVIRSTAFVGQSGKDSGAKSTTASHGMNQKDQTEAIAQFRSGAYNTLIATSIGEEGLDIGEVDVIVLYDVQKSPVRMIQRMGRTGRKRDGAVYCLLTEGTEEKKFAQMNQTMEGLKGYLRDWSRNRTFCEPGPRLLCHRKVRCERVEMTIAARRPPSNKGGVQYRKSSGIVILRDENNGAPEQQEVSGSTALEEEFLDSTGFPKLHFANSGTLREKIVTLSALGVGLSTEPSPTMMFGHSRGSRLFTSLAQRLQVLAIDTGGSRLLSQQPAGLPTTQSPPQKSDSDTRATPSPVKLNARRNEHYSVEPPRDSHDVEPRTGTASVGQNPSHAEPPSPQRESPVVSIPSLRHQEDAVSVPTVASPIQALPLESRAGRTEAPPTRKRVAETHDEAEVERRRRKRPGSRNRALVDDEAELDSCDNNDSGDEEEANDTPGSLANFVTTQGTPAAAAGPTQLVSIYRKSLLHQSVERQPQRRPGLSFVVDTPGHTPNDDGYEETPAGLSSGSRLVPTTGERTDSSAKRGPVCATESKLTGRRVVLTYDDDVEESTGSKSPHGRRSTIGTTPSVPAAAVKRSTLPNRGLTVLAASRVIGIPVVRRLCAPRSGIRCLVRDGMGPADLAVGFQCAVMRVAVSELSKGDSMRQETVLETVQLLLRRYERLVVIASDDPHYVGQRSRRAREFLHCNLSTSENVRVVTSHSEEDEIEIIRWLAEMEESRGQGLYWVKDVEDEHDISATRFFSAAPRVGYPAAAYMATSLGSIRQVLSSLESRSIGDLDKDGLLSKDLVEHCARVFSR